MRDTRVRRAKYMAAVSFITGLATSSFPVVTRAEAWHRAFANDHDARFLLDGVTDGFRYQFLDPKPDGAFYKVPNYVPDIHAPKSQPGSRLRQRLADTHPYKKLLPEALQPSASSTKTIQTWQR